MKQENFPSLDETNAPAESLAMSECSPQSLTFDVYNQWIDDLANTFGRLPLFISDEEKLIAFRPLLNVCINNSDVMKAVAKTFGEKTPKDLLDKDFCKAITPFVAYKVNVESLYLALTRV